MVRRLIIYLLLTMFAVSCTRDPNVLKRKYVESGNKYFDNGKYKEASLMYRKALQKDMRFGEAYYRLALADLKLGLFQEAVRALRRATELDPGNSDAYAILADLYLTAFVSNPDRSKGILDEVALLSKGLLDRDPNSFQGLRLAGYLALVSKDIPGAIEKFTKANEVKPLEPNVVLPMAQALSASGKFPEAEQLARQLIAKHKNFGPIYDLLYIEYTRRSRPADAEAIMKDKVAANPTEANYRLQLAAHYFGSKRRPEMLSTLQMVLADTKQWPNARAYVGDFYFRLGEFDNAIEQYQAGAKENQKDKALYQKKIVETLARQRKMGEAAQVVEAILKDDPKDVDALAMRASLSLQTGNRTQLQSAINDLQMAVTRAPQNPVLRFNIGRAYLAKGELDQARQQFREAVKLRADYLPPQIALASMEIQRGDFAKALQAADDILKVDPNNLVGRLIHANAQSGLGDRQKARAEVLEILKNNPKLAEARLQLAMLDFQTKDYKAAEQAFRELYEGTPPDSRGLMGLLEVFLAQGRGEQAVQLIQSEIGKQPDRADFQYALANTAVRAGKYDLAVNTYSKLIGQNPNRADLMLQLGETYRFKGDNDSAIKAFKKAKDLAPNNPAPLMQLALMFERSGKQLESRPVYEQILKIEPDNAIALNNLAYILAESGADLDLALTYAQRAKSKLPQEVNIADTLGWIYIKKNLSDSAIGIFRDLVNGHPENSTFRYHLGMALYQKGDKPGARKELQTALTKKPSKEEEGKIKDLLGKIG